ncbi:MAG: hypothetical protein NW203_08635 [Hyphomonadaceae bacterium]|nr:hypothetical protein [Hyphomonadaceae bacterium]
MMIAHASLPADDPERVAHVLAEIMDGEALPFPPGGPQCWMAWSGDEAIELEIVPRGRMMAPDDADGGNWRAAHPEAPRASEAHLAIAVRKPMSAIMEIARREGWRTGEYDRGGFFRLAEVWVENAFLIEFLDPAQTAAYKASMTRANWKKTFGLGAAA